MGKPLENNASAPHDFIKTNDIFETAAKMLVTAGAMLKNNEPFDETRLLAKSCGVR
jgi:hypothetical protein